MLILDCHVHLNNYNELDTSKKILSLEERVNALLESMYNNDIDYSIILSSYKVDINRPSTSEIIDVIKKHVDKLGVVAGFSIDNHTNEDLKNYRPGLAGPEAHYLLKVFLLRFLIEISITEFFAVCWRDVRPTGTYLPRASDQAWLSGPASGQRAFPDEFLPARPSSWLQAERSPRASA